MRHLLALIAGTSISTCVAGAVGARVFAQSAAPASASVQSPNVVGDQRALPDGSRRRAHRHRRLVIRRLIGVYTVLARPGVFGRALIESPTLQIYDGAVLRMLTKARALPGRIYLGIGTNEDSAPGCDPHSATVPKDDMMLALQQMVATLHAAGLDSSRLRVVAEPCATHTHAAWAARLPAVLTVLFREQ